MLPVVEQIIDQDKIYIRAATGDEFLLTKQDITDLAVQYPDVQDLQDKIKSQINDWVTQDALRDDVSINNRSIPNSGDTVDTSVDTPASTLSTVEVSLDGTPLTVTWGEE